MARHRSPQGRRTHLGLPLPPVAAAAGAGGGRVASLPTGLVGPRVVAALLAGGALAAAGQTALNHTLPVAADGANMLRLSVQEFVGSIPAAEPAASTGAAVSPDSAVSPGAAVGPDVMVAVAPAPVAPIAALPEVSSSPATPRVAAVSDLVKAADLHARAAAAAKGAAAAAEASRASARTAGVADGAVHDGGVRMVAGRVSSGFGARWGRAHNGIDIAAPIGTPIRAPLPGEVIASGPASGFGMWVRVRHDDGTVTTYGHVNRSLVRVGEEVTAGEEIAEVGNRGRSTGPHLHMEVQTPGGTTVNPRPWLDGHGIGY